MPATTNVRARGAHRPQEGGGNPDTRQSHTPEGARRGESKGAGRCNSRRGDRKASRGSDGTAADRASGASSAEPARASLYDEVTGRIVAELEAGRVPWVQPWSAGACGQGLAPGLPRNALTARAYSGVNVLILWGAVIEHGYPSQAWLTYAQALDAGGCVRKGERGTCVVYADRFTPEAEKARVRAEGGDAKSVPFLKRFTVFNVAQCEGLRPGLAPDPVPLPERQIVPVAEQVIAASGVDFRIGGNRAFYVPALDYVQVPPQPAFFEQVNYYRTCLHELTHATGHPDRLDRKLVNSFGSKDYAREELVAEMGSAFLCASLGIVPTVRHADYIASWLELLREDLSEDAAVRGTGAPRGRAIFRAASAASKAADWLLARHAAALAEAAPVDPAPSDPSPSDAAQFAAADAGPDAATGARGANEGRPA